MLKDLFQKMKTLANEGLFHIFGSSVLAKMMGLISSVVVVRQLPKVDYGYYVSANNLYSYLAIFIGMGLGSAIIQYCSEQVSQGRKNSIYRHSLLTGGVSNILVFIAILALSFWKQRTGQGEVAYYLRLMCGLPFVVFADSYQQIVLRVKLKNQIFSYANMLHSVVLLVGNVAFTILFGIPGLICSMYLSYVASAAVCSWALFREGFYGNIFRERDKLARQDRKEINSFALICAITNFASTVLVLLDVTCLDLVLGDAAVLADYKVASTIPASCAFIPSCLMTFLYPKLVAAFSRSKQMSFDSLKKLAQLFLGINGLVCVGLCVFAPLIIWAIFGPKYMNVTPIFIILSVEYLVNSARTLLGNVIAVLKKVKINLMLSVVSGFIKIGLNLILIQSLQSVGAAIATLVVSIFVATMELLYLRHYFKQQASA